MGATRDVALSELNIRGISTNETGDSAAVTVVPSDSGVIFINEFAGQTTYTLPAVAACKGKLFYFYGNVGQNLVITGGTAAKMTANGQTGYDKVTSAGTIGDYGWIIGDGDWYFFFAGQGTWTAGT